MGDSDDDVHLGTKHMCCACLYNRVLLLRSLQTVVAVQLFDQAGKKALSTCNRLGVGRAHMTPCMVCTAKRRTLTMWHTHIYNRQKTK